MAAVKDMEVIHDQENHRFILSLDNGIVQTKYRMVDEKTIEFYSTHTPVESRGRGLAARVVEGALKYANQKHLNIIASCWYVKKIIDQRAA